MKRSLKILLFCVTCLVLVSWDKTTKEMAKQHLMNSHTRSYFHDIFRLEYVENTGAALSLGDGLSKTASFWVFSMLPLALLTGVSVYAIKNSAAFSPFKLFAFALIIAGGLGNILDRLLFDRHVTDFMNLGLGDLRTGIFNFADVWVTAGAVALILVYRKPTAESAH